MKQIKGTFFCEAQRNLFRVRFSGNLFLIWRLFHTQLYKSQESCVPELSWYNALAFPLYGIESPLSVKSEETVNQTHKEREGANTEDTCANFYVICTYDPFLFFTSVFPRS